MTKKSNNKKKRKDKRIKNQNIFIKIFRFFVPKNWNEEIIKGQMIGADIRSGKITPKVIPTYWLGRLIRKIVDPKHKKQVGTKKNELL